MKIHQLFFKIILIIFSLFLFIIAINADESQLKEAISLYKDGQYAEALNIFKELNKNSYSSGLFYNIGNCHIKLNNLGEAISNYYSALQRSPENADIQHNLKHAISLTIDKIYFNQDIKGIKDVIHNIISYFSINTLQNIFIFLLLILILVIIISRLKYQIFFQYISLSLLISCLLFIDGLSIITRYKDIHQSRGVIKGKEVKVRYGPGFNNTKAFILHEGTMVKIFKASDNWSLIQINKNKSGWIPSKTLIIIT